MTFAAGASNLVPDDTNGQLDVFSHDRATGVTERVSVDSASGEANGASFIPDINGDVTPKSVDWDDKVKPPGPTVCYGPR